MVKFIHSQSCKQSKFAYREKNNAVVVKTKSNHFNIYEKLFTSTGTRGNTTYDIIQKTVN